ncbi:MAG: helix-turn-helix domain-containing protein, partial [Bacteroidota bacterium]
FWIVIGPTINVDWTADWFDPYIRPRTPAPLSVIIFAVYFYVNAFVLIPQYFDLRSWKQYLSLAFILFIAPEVLRVAIYVWTGLGSDVESTLLSRDSFLFGSPSPFFLALNASFLYGFIRSRFFKRVKPTHSPTVAEKQATVPYEHQQLLSPEEALALEQKLMNQLEKEEIYLKPELTLRELAGKMESTEKKVSFLLNQNLQTGFYELMNKYRVEKFKAEVSKAENEHLSTIGIALNCGFKSKSSFYRAFKAQVAMSPSAYIKEVVKKAES